MKQQGVVKWFSSEKGYGFVSGEDKDFFFHKNYIIPLGRILEKNQEVTFTPDKAEKGWRALEVSAKEEA